MSYPPSFTREITYALGFAFCIQNHVCVGYAFGGGYTGGTELSVLPPEPHLNHAVDAYVIFDGEANPPVR